MHQQLARFSDLVLVIVYTYDLNLPPFLSLVSAGISVPAEASGSSHLLISEANVMVLSHEETPANI